MIAPTGAGRRRALTLTVQISAAAIFLGALVGTVLSSDMLAGAMMGAIASAIIAPTLCGFEMIVMEAAPGRALRRLPFFALFLLRTAVYLAVSYLGFVLGYAATFGLWTWTTFDRTRVWSLAYSALFSMAVNFVMLVRRLAGPGVIARFVLGRYYRPRAEQRYFLFLDIVGSTAIAEAVGPARFHELLNQVMYDIAAGAAETGGEIHKYVGDEAIVTWLATGAGVDPRPARCVALIVERLDARAAYYAGRFGAPVRVRAGLHRGAVVTGELGDQRQEIAMLGDGINTAARLVDAARDSGQAIVATPAAADPAAAPAGWRIRPLGPVALRGKAQAIELLAIERASPTTAAR